MSDEHPDFDRRACKRPIGNRHDWALIRHDKCYACEVERLTTEVAELKEEVYRRDCDIEGYQQEQDEIIVALGSRGILRSEIVAEVGRATAEGSDRWVSVDDREPECDEMTQFLVHYKATPGFIYTKWRYKGEWYSTWGDHISNSPARKHGISHWMRIPESPLACDSGSQATAGGLDTADDSSQTQDIDCPSCNGSCRNDDNTDWCISCEGRGWAEAPDESGQTEGGQ